LFCHYPLQVERDLATSPSLSKHLRDEVSEIEANSESEQVMEYYHRKIMMMKKKQNIGYRSWNKSEAPVI
jgi:hypothetical protein